MYGRLIVLGKQPGVCLVRSGETWRQFFAKCAMEVTEPEATNVFQDDQLCAGLKARIDGDVHGVKYLWDANSSTENWGFLLVNKKTCLTNSIALE